MIPYLGLSFQSAVVALTFLAMPPILISTDGPFVVFPRDDQNLPLLGMSQRAGVVADRNSRNASRFMAGIKTKRRWRLSPVRPLAAFIGAGGLGFLIVLGVFLYDQTILLVGPFPCAGPSWLKRLSLAQRSLTPDEISCFHSNSLDSPDGNPFQEKQSTIEGL
jgi:osmoprotectant transport system permease protein